MDIRITHTFPCTPAAYWEVTSRPQVDAEMRAAGDADFETLSERAEGDRQHSRRRVTARSELPLVVRRALGRDRLSYVQEVETDNAAFSTTWKVIPDVLADRVRCSGTTRVVPTPAGCERRIEGVIEVGVPLVGGTIEKFIVTELERSWNRAAEVVRRHLSGS